MLVFNFVRRQKTDTIFVRTWTQSEDIGVREVRARARWNGFLDLPFHFVVRQSGEIEDGRDVHTRIGEHSTSVRILVLCKDETPSVDQDKALSDLIGALKLDFPNAEVVVAV